MAVIGASVATPEQAQIAEEVGRRLARAGAIVICGGGGGVMAAVSQGAAEAGGTVVGILPGEDRLHANRWVTIALPTGMGELRNGLIVRAADVAIAVGGAYGTLSEIALALVAEVPVVGLGTWEVEGVQRAESAAQAVDHALAQAADRTLGQAADRTVDRPA